MSVFITRSGFWAVSILNISDGYPNAFLYVEFLACLSICTDTTFPKLNFLFMPTWKSKVAHGDLMKDRVYGGEMRGKGTKLIWP